MPWRRWCSYRAGNPLGVDEPVGCRFSGRRTREGAVLATGGEGRWSRPRLPDACSATAGRFATEDVQRYT
nr:unnamed protein product [Digitaria exilis]